MPPHPIELRNCELFEGLQDGEIEEILAAGRQVRAQSGAVVCSQGDDGSSMYLIQSGRVQISAKAPDGDEVLLNTLGHGCHFGEISMLTRGPRTATVTSLMDTELLEIRLDAFRHLVSTIPGFAANLSRTLGIWLRGQLSSRTRRRALRVATLVRTGGVTEHLALQLAEGLGRFNLSVSVFTDRPDAWPAHAAFAIRSVRDHEGRLSIRGDELARAVDEHGHTLIDIDANYATESLLMQSELVWWLIDRQDRGPDDEPSPAEARIAAVERLASRVQVVWLQPRQERLPEVGRHALPSERADLRVLYEAAGSSSPVIRRADIARLSHQLMGVHLGLALGGGGARGIAHLGVIKVLEEEGFYFDRLAGTSAGAIIAAAAAVGMSVEATAQLLDQEMAPPRWLSWIPGSARWYLLALFRMGLVEPKFRRYLGDTSFEQLAVPCHIISVDLVSGDERIRERGDVVRSILESINHPVFGKPLLHGSEALVDGGVLINVPASVLRKRGADFVVAVDVGAKLSPDFGRLKAGRAGEKLRAPGYFSTLTRVIDVSQRGLALLHMSESDYLLTPDTSPYPFEDFTQGEGLMAAGEAAAKEAVPQIKQLFAEFLAQG